MKCSNCEILENKIKNLTQQVTLDGWKGKDKIEIKRISTEYWTITEHRKSKTTSEITTSTKRVLNDDVCKMLNVINTLTHNKTIKETKYAEIVPHMIAVFDLDVTRDAFNGGKFRTLYYFPLYYYPLKILEHLEFVKYSGHGKVTPLSKFNKYFSELYKLKQSIIF